MIGKQDLPGDVSIYIHVPFCSKKCPYCHFFVLPDKPLFKEQYLHSLFQEWALRFSLLEGKRVVSIYFGGGTPSRLEPAQIGLILEKIRSTTTLAPTCEITLELNPEDGTFERLMQWNQAGVNRLSVGIQSLNDSELITLDRQHSGSRGIEVLYTAAAAGFENLSIDLMYDLPTQTQESWIRTLEQLEPLPLTHLSLYNLTLEPHTVFFKRREQLLAQLPSPEISTQMLHEALVRLPKQGLQQYEISAFAKPGRHSLHNTGYWTGRPFLGLGPSAYSYWNGSRFRNVAHLNRYSEQLAALRLPVDFEETLTYPRNLTELLAIQLRLLEGVDISLFEQRHGLFPTHLKASLAQNQEKGWLVHTGNTLQLTEQGRLFYDSVAVSLI